MTEYLCFKIGRLKFTAALINEMGEIEEEKTFPTPRTDLASLEAAISKIAEDYHDKIAGLAFICPGRIDPKTKEVDFCGALPFKEKFSPVKVFGEKFQVPVIVDNVAPAAATGEIWLGQLKKASSGVLLNLETGIDSSFVFNQQVVRGVNTQAGDLNYLILDPRLGVKNVLNCAGWQGSAVNLVRTINHQLANIDLYDARTAFAAIKAGNPTAEKLFADYCRTLAMMIFNMNLLLDPGLFVISGEIGTQSLLIEGIKQQFEKLVQENPMLSQQLIAPQIVAAQNPVHAALLGAVHELIINK